MYLMITKEYFSVVMPLAGIKKLERWIPLIDH